MDKIKEKSYSEIIAELESFEMMKKTMLILSVLQMLIAYCFLRIGQTYTLSILLFILALINLIIPTIVKDIYYEKKY